MVLVCGSSEFNLSEVSLCDGEISFLEKPIIATYSQAEGIYGRVGLGGIQALASDELNINAKIILFNPRRALPLCKQPLCNQRLSQQRFQSLQTGSPSLQVYLF